MTAGERPPARPIRRSPTRLLKQTLFGKALRTNLAATLSRQVRVSIAVEQLPEAGNRVTIDPAYRDPFGNPRPVIAYRVGDYTMAGMAAATGVAKAMFHRALIEDHSGPGMFPTLSYEGKTFYYHGMGHFAGTHRMGADATSGVVDADQRAFGHRNLFLVGAGSMPTMGTSNPTLTLAALTLRTADLLVAELTRA